MGCEGQDVLQQWRPQVRAAFEHALQWRRWQLQQHAVGLRLGPLAALHKPLPHLRVLPHLWVREGVMKNGNVFEPEHVLF